MEHSLDIRTHAHLPVVMSQEGITIGNTTYTHGSIRVTDSSAVSLSQLINGWQSLPLRMPLAAHVFQITKELTSLAHFFPILDILDQSDRTSFRTRLNALLQSPLVSITYRTAHGIEVPPLIVRAIILAQIVSCFWCRAEIVDALCRTRPRFAIFAHRQQYEQAGGVGGGCYIPDEHCIMLEVNRLFEGFYTPHPNVSPFLHEFGHMLDGTHMRLNQLPHCQGRLPLMYDDEMNAWQRAKQLEVQCYTAWYHRRPPASGQMPLGHPYVFQNDGEFLAGHWEMFWRNPHAMAQRTPHLFAAFERYTNQDPRTWLSHDYTGYVEGNTAFYRSGQQPWPCAIRYDVLPD